VPSGSARPNTRGPERFRSTFLNVQSPPFGSGQRYELRFVVVCTVRFDEIFGPARAKGILTVAATKKHAIRNAHRTVPHLTEKPIGRPAFFNPPLLNGLCFLQISVEARKERMRRSKVGEKFRGGNWPETGD